MSDDEDTTPKKKKSYLKDDEDAEMSPAASSSSASKKASTAASTQAISLSSFQFRGSDSQEDGAQPLPEVDMEVSGAIASAKKRLLAADDKPRPAISSKNKLVNAQEANCKCGTLNRVGALAASFSDSCVDY